MHDLASWMRKLIYWTRLFSSARQLLGVQELEWAVEAVGTDFSVEVSDSSVTHSGGSLIT